MTAATHPTDQGDSLVLLLGRHQAEAMRFFWACGQATALELHHWLTRDSPLAYTTVATICVRLARKGLLHRQRTRLLDGHICHGTRYLYTPCISEQEFVRREIGEQPPGLLTHEPALIGEQLARYVKPEIAREAVAHELSASPDLPVTDVATLLQRVERAERQAAVWQTEAQQAHQIAQAASERAALAEHQAMLWEAEARRAHQRALLAEAETAAVLRQTWIEQCASAAAVQEHYDPAGVCRVCSKPAASVPFRRRDGLRVCEEASCKQEAHRRDNLAAQHVFRERRR